MTTPDDPRLAGRSRPDGPGVDLDAYHGRYQNDVLAGHAQAEDDHLAWAHFHALGAVPPTQATEVFSPRGTDTAPQAHAPIGISPAQALGQPPAPITPTRARPSDYDDEETW
jgi:hypothetical protein